MNATFTLAQALSTAREVLASNKAACTYAYSYLFNGTLYVVCTPTQAARIETKLNELTGGGIIVSRVGAAFSFDFV